jgi:hypothetical protein
MSQHRFTLVEFLAFRKHLLHMTVVQLAEYFNNTTILSL